ncbi:MAG: hypothetical protein HYW34_03560 [Candidatus Brennerbacteria bacterium]|nr:hypothetical protein [Candidatus Brennerbacteria bacterium]
MKNSKLKPKFNNGWCFAIVNGRLAEIYFQKKYGAYGHCYVKRKKYRSKKEQKMIDADIKKFQFIYRKGYYIDKLTGIKSKIPKIEEVFPGIKNKNRQFMKS